MRSQSSIAEAVNGVTEHFRAHPESGRSNDAPATATLDGGLRFQVSHPNGMTIATDMPAGFGGEASAPSPGWLLRAASAACNATMIAVRAAQEGIPLDELTVVVDSVSDDRGMVGVDDTVPAGPLEASVHVRVRAAGADPERLRQVVAWARTHSPVVDAVGRAIPTSFEVAVEVG